jgi:hypothetical protein
MIQPRVYADFHNLDDANRVRLTCSGTQRDLDRQGIQLRDGLQLTLYTDDEDDDGRPDALLADATARFDRDQECWVAEVDWTALRHESDEVVHRVK